MRNKELLGRLIDIQHALECGANPVATVKVTEFICEVEATIRDEEEE